MGKVAKQKSGGGEKISNGKLLDGEAGADGLLVGRFR